LTVVKIFTGAEKGEKLSRAALICVSTHQIFLQPGRLSSGFVRRGDSMFPAIDLGALERYRVPATGRLPKLVEIDPRDQDGLPYRKPEAKKATAADTAEISRLQEILYAQAKHAILVVLQGMDTSGKDSTIRVVFGPINPLGVVATSFKKPTAQELAHDFLWRVHLAVPPVRIIGIFNRSHYEDVVTARVQGLAPRERVEARYDEINAFEKHLAENGVTILKFFLHISKKEQSRRLRARRQDPTKRWKFSAEDLAARKCWDDYMEAYRLALQRCSSVVAPWFIVPADRKWYRNAVVARIVRTALEALDLRYPREMPGLDKVMIR
jgi:PPK2 family polyphosphate:nucleotide phosphotransferase